MCSMPNNPKKFLSLVLVLIFTGSVSLYIYKDLSKSFGQVSEESYAEILEKPVMAVETKDRGLAYTIKVEDSTMNNEVAKSRPKMPNLERKVVNYSGLNDTAFSDALKNISILKSEIEKSPLNEANWLSLATYRKIIGDFEASVEILDYVTILWPKDYVPFNNLADLYQFYLKNYPLAEKNWLKVIEINPSYEPAYDNLYMLYMEQYRTKQSLALPLLFKGLENNPNSVAFLVHIARHYRGAGENKQAILYYDRAIKEAKASGNNKLASNLKAESEELAVSI